MSTFIVILIALALYFGLLAFVLALCKMAARGDAAQSDLYAACARDRQLGGRSARLAPRRRVRARSQRDWSYS